MSNGEISISGQNSPGSAGATVRASYVERQMTFYAIDRREITSISIMSGLTLAFCSVGSFLLSLGIGFAASRFFTDTLTPFGEVLSSVGAGILLVLAIVFYILALCVFLKRRSEINDILNGPSTKATVKVQASGE